MKKLPVGLQNFQKIIEEDYLYIDKTRQIYELITMGSLYFLSRPRRFGKSLLVSSLKQIFKGDQALFKNLYIGTQTDYQWEKYPVLQFNFAAFGHQQVNLEELLMAALEKHAATYQITLSQKGLSDTFQSLVEQIAKKDKPVVILVDEYDKPIVDFLTDKVQAKKNRKVLKKFFSPLKDLEEKGHLHFLFVTGVSKFSRVSIFSDLNNLTDLTVNKKMAGLLGITETELLDNFEPHIQSAIQELNMSRERLLEALKLWYDGYSWDGKNFVYNPFSLLNFFNDNRFANYWFSSGTPTFLVETLRNKRIGSNKIESKEVTDTFFDKFSISKLDIYSLLFQTGYLTISKVRYRPNSVRLIYTLDYPNQEVKEAFNHNLLEAYSFKSPTIVSDVLVKMETALLAGEVKNFIKQLKILLSDISYHLMPKGKKNPTSTNEKEIFKAWEGYFQTIVYLISSFLNLNVQTEITKHKGRLDLIATTDDFIYLMEFKLDEPAKDAIKQIKSRKYAAAYENSPKTIFLVGIGFSKNERNVKTWRSQKWKRKK